MNINGNVEDPQRLGAASYDDVPRLQLPRGTQIIEFANELDDLLRTCHPAIDHGQKLDYGNRSQA